MRKPRRLHRHGLGGATDRWRLAGRPAGCPAKPSVSPAQPPAFPAAAPRSSVRRSPTRCGVPAAALLPVSARGAGRRHAGRATPSAHSEALAWWLLSIIRTRGAPPLGMRGATVARRRRPRLRVGRVRLALAAWRAGARRFSLPATQLAGGALGSGRRANSGAACGQLGGQALAQQRARLRPVQRGQRHAAVLACARAGHGMRCTAAEAPRMCA